MKKKIISLFLIILSLVICCPILFLISGSLMGKGEIQEYLSPILSSLSGYASFSIIPKYPTLRSFVKLFLDSPEFFVMFWNSVKIVFFVLFGQLIVGVLAAWGFARYEFPCKKILFTLYIVLMLMPFQVTMLSSYLVLDSLKLIDTQLSIILPGIFSTFSVFIMYRFFKNIPNEIIEAARIDGAGEVRVLVKIGIPLGMPGIASAMILGFFEYWNLIEQPLTFLKNKTLWPLSIYLPNINLEYTDIAFVASVVTLIVAVTIFFAGQKYLEEGIATTAEKE